LPDRAARSAGKLSAAAWLARATVPSNGRADGQARLDAPFDGLADLPTVKLRAAAAGG